MSGPESEEGEPTLYEEMQEERTAVEVEQRRETWQRGAFASADTHAHARTVEETVERQSRRHTQWWFSRVSEWAVGVLPVVARSPGTRRGY
jgi:hypothetical protein